MAGCWPKLRRKRTARTRSSPAWRRSSSANVPSVDPSSTKMSSHGLPAPSSDETVRRYSSSSEAASLKSVTTTEISGSATAEHHVTGLTERSHACSSVSSRMGTLLLRHVTCGRVVTALPVVVVEREPGATRDVDRRRERRSRTRSAARDGRLLPFDEWEVELRSWAGRGRLELTPFGRRHSIRLFVGRSPRPGLVREPPGALTESRFGFDTTDWQLDLWIESSGDVHWKDEDDLEQAVELGIMTAEEGRLARDEAHRVLDEWPFPTGWEDWRPDPGWEPPELPEGWDVV